MEYHNFKVRRPVHENGEAAPGTPLRDLRAFYEADLKLIQECAALFVIPLGRDPGTLVELGIALQQRKPVVTYDPRKENQNTMVICGSTFYSSDLGDCLNALFEELSKLRKQEK